MSICFKRTKRNMPPAWVSPCWPSQQPHPDVIDRSAIGMSRAQFFQSRPHDATEQQTKNSIGERLTKLLILKHGIQPNIFERANVYLVLFIYSSLIHSLHLTSNPQLGTGILVRHPSDLIIKDLANFGLLYLNPLYFKIG